MSIRLTAGRVPQLESASRGGGQVTLIFDGNDEAYQTWLRNPDGWVLNTRRHLNPSYMVLHAAMCSSVTNYNDMARPGGFTERSYIKVCSTQIEDLNDWVHSHGRRDGSFRKECGRCAKRSDQRLKTSTCSEAKHGNLR
jgi:hypothetical protein